MEVDIVKDLTDRTAKKTKKFKLDPDVFECSPKLPAGVVQDMNRLRRMRSTFEATGTDAEAAESLAEEALEKLFGLLDIIMLRESAERFAERMRDPDNPIDMDDINRFLSWAIEEYGGRPTQPSSGSSTSPNGTGSSSTDGVLPAPLIPVPSA